MRRIVSALLMAATLAAPFIMPMSVNAGPRVNLSIRVFDPFRHDYHRWNRREEYAYRRYLAERHARYLRYERQRAAERRAYWRWRHKRLERGEHR